MYPKIFAHRGASDQAPENTMPAFELACELGADAFELDVHLTADGEIVVIHDDTVDRTSNGTGRVREMTFAELSALDFSNGKPGYAGVRLPLLADVLRLAQRNGLCVNAEIKEYSPAGAPELIRRLLELEKSCGMSGKILYSSFDHHLLRELKKISARTPTAVLYADGLIDAWDYAEKLHAQAVHPYFPLLGLDSLVAQCHRRRIAVHPWTVNEEEELAAMLRAGADGVITNRPDLAGRVRGRIFPEGGPLK